MKKAAKLGLGLVLASLALGQAHAQVIGQTISKCGNGAATGNSPFYVDPQGNLCVRSAPNVAGQVTANSALASSQVLKAAPGYFFSAQVNTTSAAEFVMLFDATSLPANGAVTPVAVWQVAANTTLGISLPSGTTMANGIVLGCSTTGLYTLTASALCGFSLGVVQ